MAFQDSLPWVYKLILKCGKHLEAARNINILIKHPQNLLCHIHIPKQLYQTLNFVLCKFISLL